MAEVRGKGLVWGIEARSVDEARALQDGLSCRGVFALRGGTSGTVVQIAPPLTISDLQLDYAMSAIDDVLHAAS